MRPGVRVVAFVRVEILADLRVILPRDSVKRILDVLDDVVEIGPGGLQRDVVFSGPRIWEVRVHPQRNRPLDQRDAARCGLLEGPADHVLVGPLHVGVIAMAPGALGSHPAKDGTLADEGQIN